MGRRLNAWGLQSEKGAISKLSRPYRMSQEVGRRRAWFAAIISDESFSKKRFEAGRQYYYRLSQNHVAMRKETRHFTASNATRDQCSDSCATSYNGVCEDNGFGSELEPTDANKCELGTDCHDCARAPPSNQRVIPMLTGFSVALCRSQSSTKIL